MTTTDRDHHVPHLAARPLARRHLQTLRGRLRWFRDIPPDHELHGMTPSLARKKTLDAIEDGYNDFSVLIVAATGFFADSYILFATNAIVPMLDYVYSESAPDPPGQASINTVTLLGCMVGMIVFGVLGDKYGRRKLYGIVLALLLLGTLGLVMSSSGYIPVVELGTTESPKAAWNTEGSMNIFAWLDFWRFVSGVGIGGDYPLSAVMVSELAPTKKRARMLAILFSMQAFGYATAIVVTIIVVRIAQVLNHPSPEVATDQIWRWVMGLSLVPALLAAVMRCLVPESPRFTLYVLNYPLRALQAADTLNQAGIQDEYEWNRVGRAFDSHYNPSPYHQRGPSSSERDDSDAEELVTISQRRKRNAITLRDFWQYLRTEGNWKKLAVTASTWFLLDFTFFGLGFNSPQTMAKIWEGWQPQLLEVTSLANGTFVVNSTTLPHNGIPAWNTHWKDLNVSIFTVLLQNSSRAILTSSIGAIAGALLLIFIIEGRNRKRLAYWSFAVVTAFFVIIGASYQYTNQSYQGVTITLYAFTQFCFYFGPNALTFIIAAELFSTKFRCTCHGIGAAAGKLGSIIVQVVVAYAKFPCKSGGFCRLDSPDSTWLGWLILIFSIPMLMACFITWRWLPELQHTTGREKGENRTLEDLGGEARPVKVRGPTSTAGAADIEMQDRI